MDDFTHPIEPAQGLQNSPVLVIIAQHVLARTSILNILERELTGSEIVEMATMSDLNWLSGRDIRLIALNVGDKEITDPSIEDSLAFLAKILSERSGCPVVKSRRRGDGFGRDATGSPRLFSDFDPGRSRYRRITTGACRWGLPTLTDRWAKWGVQPQNDIGTPRRFQAIRNQRG
ncbi:hypothetical protein ACFIOY_39145 [Bradyrhizobium sp. TZ2]